MTKNEAVLYKDKDLIVTIEDEVSISSKILSKVIPTANLSLEKQSKEPVYYLVASLPSATSILTSDDTLVESYIIMESLLN